MPRYKQDTNISRRRKKRSGHSGVKDLTDDCKGISARLHATHFIFYKQLDSAWGLSFYIVLLIFLHATKKDFSLVFEDRDFWSLPLLYCDKSTKSVPRFDAFYHNFN